MPVTARTMLRAMAAATPIDRLSPIARAEIAPLLSCSTCLFRTCTAGSALMINHPISAASGTSRKRHCSSARRLPNMKPSDEKPTLTPVRNSTSPSSVSSRPIRMRLSATSCKCRETTWNIRKKATIGSSARPTSARLSGIASR